LNILLKGTRENSKDPGVVNQANNGERLSDEKRDKKKDSQFPPRREKKANHVLRGGTGWKPYTRLPAEEV